MSIKSEYGKQLEAYFSGEMKGVDRLVFEGRVESDPMLKEEFEHQSDIIDSLKAHRTSELKARLSSISVEPSLIGSLLQSSVLKPVIYSVTSLAVVSATYLFFNQDAAIESHIQQLNGHKEYITASNIEINKNLALDFKYEDKKTITTVESPAKKPEVHVKAKRELSGANDIAFVVPEVGAELVTDEFRAPGLALDEAKKIENVTSMTHLDKIQINTVNSRRYGFHYRIEDNRLFLYGKFGESPYEIIELNTPDSKSLFFYYDGSFYNLNRDASEVTPLSKIEDHQLTDRLNVLKLENSN